MFINQRTLLLYYVINYYNSAPPPHLSSPYLTHTLRVAICKLWPWLSEGDGRVLWPCRTVFLLLLFSRMVPFSHLIEAHGLGGGTAHRGIRFEASEFP